MVQFANPVIKLAPFYKNVCRKYLLSRSWASLWRCSASIYTAPYTPEEQNKILQKVNDSTEEELSRYAISKARAKNLFKFKEKSGHFKSLDEILQVDSLGVKVLEKLCISILNDDAKPESKAKEKSKKSVKQLVTPFVNKLVLQDVDSIVGIHINVNALSLAHINHKAELLTWDVHHLDIKKLHITALFEFAQNLVSMLPTGDIYVMEDIQRLGTLSQQQSAVIKQNTIFTAILMTLLNVSKNVEQENKVSNKHRVLFLRPMLPARLFQIIVGGERVSAQTVVREILQDSPASEAGMKIGYTPVTVDTDLKQKYFNSSNTDREHYCQCLLLAMTFLDLIVYENPTCLSYIR